MKTWWKIGALAFGALSITLFAAGCGKKDKASQQRPKDSVPSVQSPQQNTSTTREAKKPKSPNESKTIQIEASAFRETPGLRASIDYPDYTVLLKLSNRGKENFIFDKMEIAWIPGSGKILTGVSTPGEPGGLFKIEPGETKEYWESSSGRTIFLLQDAAGKPLRFQVKLLRNGTPVWGPVSAPLPDLKSLKNVHRDKTGFPLTFTTSSGR